MSSLTEQERIALEDVFLSISSSKSFFQRVNIWSRELSQNLTVTKPFESLKTHLQARKWFKKDAIGMKMRNLKNKFEKRRKI